MSLPSEAIQAEMAAVKRREENGEVWAVKISRATPCGKEHEDCFNCFQHLPTVF